jgi:hypothetical protein
MAVVSLESPETQINMNEASILNEFKIFLRDNLISAHKSSIKEFYHRLEFNENVLEIYDVLSFIDEFKGLEEQFYNLGSESLEF